jgi:dUTPase
VVAAVPQVRWQLVQVLSATSRDQGGFGSTNTLQEENTHE